MQLPCLSVALGSSDLPFAVHDAEFYVDQLRVIVDTLVGVVPFHLVAHSMGGAVAVAFCGTYPDRVRQLVLMAPAGFIDAKMQPLRCIKSCHCCGE